MTSDATPTRGGHPDAWPETAIDGGREWLDAHQPPPAHPTGICPKCKRKIRLAAAGVLKGHRVWGTLCDGRPDAGDVEDAEFVASLGARDTDGAYLAAAIAADNARREAVGGRYSTHDEIERMAAQPGFRGAVDHVWHNARVPLHRALADLRTTLTDPTDAEPARPPVPPFVFTADDGRIWSTRPDALTHAEPARMDGGDGDVYLTAARAWSTAINAFRDPPAGAAGIEHGARLRMTRPELHAIVDADRAPLLAEVERLRAAMHRLVDHDDDPCDIDHNGYCQAHGLSSAPCSTAEARRLLGLDGGNHG